MTELQLSAEQEAEAQALFARVKGAFEREAVAVARIMASKADGQILGKTEFEVRAQVHRLGAQVLEAVLQERKKKATRGHARAVPVARSPRGASATGAKRS